MAVNKQRICLITNWYPSSDAPQRGLFFKEQAFAVSEYFDFIVLHYIERIKFGFHRKYSRPIVYHEKNTTEYTIQAYYSPFLLFFEMVEKLKRAIGKGEKIEGIGKYTPKRVKEIKKRRIIRIFENEILEKKIDALYCVDAQLEAFYLQCISEHYHIPYIIGEHAPVPWPGSLIADINKTAIEGANAFLAISIDKIRQLMLQNIHLPRIVYIGNLIDENKLSINYEIINRQEKTFIIIASYSFYKNYDHFIEVFNRLTEITDKVFSVMIVGYSPSQYYSVKAKELEKKIQESKFAQSTQMIPCVPHDNIKEVLNQANAFVMTSVQEGQPVSALEAACCGLPIFSTRCGGVEDYVDDSIGRLFKMADVGNFAQTLKEFLDGAIVFEPDHIRETIVRRYGMEAFVNTFKDLFLEEINNART